MPSRSEQQHKTMQAAAANKEFADQIGIPQKVARDYVDADKHDKDYENREKVKKAGNLCMDVGLYGELFGDTH